MAFDPGAEHLAFLELSIALNNFGTRFKMFNKLVSDEKKIVFNGWSARSSSFSFAESSADQHYIKAKEEQKTMSKQEQSTVVSLDDVVREDVLYLKVDVEGFEPSVFKSAHQLLEKYRVHYILFEMTHYLYKWNDKGYFDDVLTKLAFHGYKIFDIEAVDPAKDPEGFIPNEAKGMRKWLEQLKLKCPTETIHYCQINMFAVHPKAIKWPL